MATKSSEVRAEENRARADPSRLVSVVHCRSQ
jgi:hypothetical protein